MAGDWIKMRKSLPRDSRVIRIASALNADRLRVVGGLFSAWCLFDEQTEDGTIPGYTPELLDELVNFPGLARAMESVGWLDIGPDFLAVPRYDEHNGQSAKRRAQDRDRKVSTRKADKRPAAKQTKSGTEKSIEKSIESLSPLPPPGDSESEGDIELIQKIRSIHPQWNGNPSLSPKEREAFTAVRDQFFGFTSEDWATQNDFLHAKLPAGDATAQVKVLQVYLENPNRTLGNARHWKGKQRPSAKPIAPSSSRNPDKQARIAAAEELKEMMASAKSGSAEPLALTSP